MYAAMELARDYHREKFQVLEEAKRAERLAERARRMETETLFIIGPSQAAELRDEHIGFGSQARTDDDLRWAEERVANLGFAMTNEGRKRSYTKQSDEWIIYADPRPRGLVSFRVFKRAKRANRSAKIVWETPYREFKLQDSWKVDLIKKFDARLSKALK